MRKKHARILPHVLLRVLPAAVLILFVIWFTARSVATRAVRQEVNERLAVQAVQTAGASARKLKSLADTVRGLAMNNLIIHGLIDAEDRRNYLPTFFQSLRIPGPGDVRITLTDYRGQPVVSNKGIMTAYTKVSWLEEVMNGHELFQISTKGFLIAMPVLYSGLPEGSLVVEYSADQVSKILEISSLTTAYAIIHNKKDVLFSSGSSLGKVGGTNPGTEIRGWIQKREPLPGFPELSLICAEPVEKAFGALSRLDNYLLLAMILDLIVLAAGVVLSTELLARPLTVFVQKINEMGEDWNLKHKIPETGPEEIYVMAQAFNTMFDNLKDARKRLLMSATECGFAQLAAMTLHNISNAVTPMKIQIESMKTGNSDQISDYLDKCYLEINEHIPELSEYVTEDPRGKEVFAYMGTLISSLKEQGNQKDIITGKLSKSVDYISEILTAQQAYASGRQEIKEEVDLNSVVEDAIRMQTDALEKREIVIKKNLDSELPKLVIDKNRLMQVMINLIKNSYEAIDDLKNLKDNDREKKIIIKSFSSGNNIGFEITDSGIGIEPEEIETIFEFGKSGKGSSGFGLHYCKMFVEANKGELKFTSPGKGKGGSVAVVFFKG
ncbi:HAMP domain-containing sensor histidine kinase [Desulfococcaceae bacterium HSG8]|nr:HAMP domain-containing sensor histidine kinase [Desulfococcaceae bacterium HSG8]